MNVPPDRGVVRVAENVFFCVKNRSLALVDPNFDTLFDESRGNV